MQLKLNFKLFASVSIVFFSLWNSILIAEPDNESIINFNSHITVNENGSVYVEEEIEIYSKQQRIKHGIYRDFPTIYVDKSGKKNRIPVRVLDISRDGQREDFFITSINNGIRIYIGNRNSLVPYGTHTYVIRYKVARQVGFFKDFDEIYWNVTGNFWDFPIEHARAVVQLPTGAKIIREAAFAGVFGSTGRDYTYHLDENGNAVFETTQLLQPKEGLTVAVDFEKGFVEPPTPFDDFLFMVKDNLSQIIMFASIVFLLVYYILTWRKLRTPTKKEAVIPLFQPPKDLSPAATAYILKMGSIDNKLTFPSAIVDLAIKGFLKIKNTEEEYVLQKIKDPTSDLPIEEYTLLEDIFSEEDTFTFNKENSLKLGKFISTFSAKLSESYSDPYFSHNYKYIGKGVLSNFLAFLLVALIGPDEFFSILIASFIFMASIIYIFIGMAIRVKQLYNLSTVFAFFRIASVILKSAIIVLVNMVFLLFWFLSSSAEVDYYSFLANTSGCVMVIIHAIFIFLLKQPTDNGKQIIGEIEGFKLFLSVTEQDRYKVLNSPKVTTDTFEKYLPFAIALGVEEEWSKQLDKGHSPNWYESTGNNVLGSNSASFVSIGNSMCSNISSIAPAAIVGVSDSGNSGSGGGGGGSSGGGGGGGGW